MRERVSEESGKHAREVIERQVAHLRRMLDDLLDVARVAEGKLDLQKTRIDGRDAIQDALSVTSALCEQHRHSLSVSLPDGDRTRLQQVFANRLTNAAKYTDDGGKISLTVQSDGPTATIRILDNGKGIAPGALPHVFDLFMREAQEHRSGLGIGLKIVRALVELHGGTVTAHSGGSAREASFA